MKAKFSGFILAILIFSGCQKENTFQTAKHDPFKDSALLFLKNNAAAGYANLDTNTVRILTWKSENLGMMIAEKGTSDFILLKKNNRNFSAKRIHIEGMNTPERNGSILLQNLERTQSQKLIVQNNQVINFHSQMRLEPITLPEVVIVGHVNHYSFDFLSLFWLFDQQPTYSYFYTPDMFGGGGGGGSVGAPSVAAAPQFISPANPVDAKDEVKCFTAIPSSTYSVTVNVNQPIPNSRDVFDPTASFSVGHTFLTLEQDNADGSKIIRNLGFYPVTMVKPGSTSDNSTFGDDSGTPFDVSLRISISSADMTAITNSLINSQYHTYDLNSYNCTNVPMNALKSIGVHLPETNSNNVFFNGYNPADLGEDIRGLDLNTLSKQSGNKQMTRTQSNSNSQNPPKKTGGC